MFDSIIKNKVIKVVVLLLILISTKGYAQQTILNERVSLVKENTSIGDILSELENKLGFTTSYSGNTIDLSQKKSINSSNQTLNEILRNLFPSKLYRFKVLGKKLLIYKRVQRVTLSGYTLEEGSQEYLSNVSIYIKEQSIGAVSNDYGFYSLSVPEGTHEVFISFVGYKTITKTIDFNKDITLNFILEPDTQYLDEIVITSDRSSLKSEVTQMSSESITPAIIKDTPAIFGEKDAVKTLQLLPGVKAGNEGSAGFYVRGGTPDQNLIILDESIVYNSNHLFGIFSIFNGDAIKTVEMFKGGFPARYGGRLSSVVKIDTKNGNKEKIKGNVNISLISSSFMLEGPLKKDKTSFVLSGRRTYLDLLVRPFLESNNDFSYNFSDITTKIHHVFDEKNKLYWSLYFGEDKYKRKERFEDEGVNDKTDERIQWGNITSTLRWNHEFNNKLFSNTSLIFSNYKFQNEQLESNINNSSFNSSNSGIDDYGLKVDFNYYPNPKHTLKFGMLSTYHNFKPKAITIRDSEDIDISNTQRIRTFESALYVEDNWEFNKKLNINPGLRLSYFQHKSKVYFKPEIRFALAYRLKPTLAIKASYAKMNQYIHRLSNSGLGLPTDLWISSTEGLKPQVSEQVAIGLAKDFGDDMYEATLEAYYKKMDDIIEFKEGASFASVNDLSNITSSIQTVDFVNGLTTGEGWAYGSEFLLRKKRGKFTGWLGYTLSWSERQFEELNQGRRFRDRFDRRHDISLLAVYKLDRPKKENKKTTLSANWVFSSGINFNVPNTVGLDPTTDFPINDGDFPGVSVFNEEKNNFKGEDFHRLVLGIQFHKITKRKRERTWGFSFYNVYARKNPFFYQVNTVDFETNRRVLSKGYIFLFVPSFNYNLKF
ncbi:TonB-dependent receptor [Aquimarina sp. D1M17]|uniref:TonB-dependent receptor n=1 Tax=Aquimarina acroporae TaxID=2937283 RepID=UPI0020BE18C4|nr:TonB-dependent receptor [Aquimarina acroporae]MCK8524274.1 TonB-dependent receptor [Aquimarina acroporae]